MNKWLMWVGIAAGALLIAFLLGFVPMWLQKRAISSELETIKHQLRKSEIRGLLTTALVETNRGEYESGRKNASEFFTLLRAEIDKEDSGSLTKTERDKLKSVMDNRDSTVTMLAQRDQASIQRLTDIYFNYQEIVGKQIAVEPTNVTSPAVNKPAQ